ncbi:hypothetical protein BU26DRAFT_572035 [Trematosphaeria pertusa]|uniref:Uncharacterized protein n=1 Tax=Trematosphaeria pertusa TaxID=390896 RepID=A0A6A6HUR3_9PLEO|nr:uncharacterized protein BU26DRAFT_572035 [Trematosphaeria pertusa]KAF2241180.1 hypothetical protein BU26DRAFT_572035 [Trematosphaeria pertusa]
MSLETEFLLSILQINFEAPDVIPPNLLPELPRLQIARLQHPIPRQRHSAPAVQRHPDGEHSTLMSQQRMPQTKRQSPILEPRFPHLDALIPRCRDQGLPAERYAQQGVMVRLLELLDQGASIKNPDEQSPLGGAAEE